MKSATYLFFVCSLHVTANYVSGSPIDSAEFDESFMSCAYGTIDEFFDCLRYVPLNLSDPIAIDDYIGLDYANVSSTIINVDLECDNITIRGFSELEITNIDTRLYDDEPDRRDITIDLEIPTISLIADCHMQGNVDDEDAGFDGLITATRENLTVTVLIQLNSSTYLDDELSEPSEMVTINSSDVFPHHVRGPEEDAMPVIIGTINIGDVPIILNGHMEYVLRKYANEIIQRALMSVLTQIKKNLDDPWASYSDLAQTEHPNDDLA